jgi:tyrosine-specific transport protein
MLALPVITSFAGLLPSFLFLGLCWLFFYATAYLFLDVNLSFEGNVNMITMAGRTLGTVGRVVCWVTYLLLLYSLTAAYIAGSAPLFVKGVKALGWEVPNWLGPFPLLVLFGLFVYLGTRSVDVVNRLLMAGLVLAYGALVMFLPSHVDMSLLTHVDFPAIRIAIPILFTAFGFHIIIPTLTTYMDRNVKELRLTLLIGSLIPFVIYAIWEFLVIGVVPLTGPISLCSAWLEGQPGSVPLAAIVQNSYITTLANFFSFFAIITSFLGVSLSLSDFLGDGLKMHRFTWGRELACLLTYLPPLGFVLTYQRGFILALEYAGIFVAILLGALPAFMAWTLPKYRTGPKRLLLATIMFISLFVIGLDLFERFGMLKDCMAVYRNV